jgi:hypothetical protein
VSVSAAGPGRATTTRRPSASTRGRGGTGFGSSTSSAATGTGVTSSAEAVTAHRSAATERSTGERTRPVLGSLAAVSLLVGLLSLGTTIGGDALWLAAMGQAVVEGGGIPRGVPYAVADSSEWVNVPVLSELVFYLAAQAGGVRGLLLLHLAAIAVGLATLAWDARRSWASHRAIAGLLTLLVVGVLLTVLVVRLQLFSLTLLPVLLALLRSEARQPSHRIWLLVPLLALWSNLHGAALVGLAVAGAYLVAERSRHEPGVAAGVVVASTTALCLTPALHRTPVYYWSALNNESAALHEGLWARVDPGSPFDVVMLLAIAVMVALAVRSRPRAWEMLAMAGLAVLTLQAARNGVWLLMLTLGPAASCFRGSRPVSAAPWRALLGVSLGLLLVVGAVVRGPVSTSASAELVERTVRSAQSGVVLAEGSLGEQVVWAGGRVWLTNPLDAYPGEVQREYMDWQRTGSLTLVPPQVDWVLVVRGGASDQALVASPQWRRVGQDSRARLYARQDGTSVSGDDST